MSYLDKVELTRGRGGYGRRGEEITLPPSALASGGGTMDRAKHWLRSGHGGKGCEGKGVMMKGIK